MSYIEHLFRFSEAKKVTSGPLVQAVDDLVARSNLPPVPLYITPGTIPNAAVAINRQTNQAMGLYVTEPYLKALDCSRNGPVTQEFKAVIGHEFGHIKAGGTTPYLIGGKLPMIALPIAAALLYDRMRDPDTKQQESRLTTLSKNSAAAATGLAAGGFIANNNAQQIEFFCDRYGASLTSPQAMRNALIKLDKAQQRFAEELAKDPKAKEEIVKHVATWKGLGELFGELTLNAHPSMAARLDRLQQMEKSAREATETVRPASALIPRTLQWLGKGESLVLPIVKIRF